MLGYSVAFQIVLLTDVLLFAFPVDRGNLFSCHHKISIFCKSSEDLSPLQYAFRRMLTVERIQEGDPTITPFEWRRLVDTIQGIIDDPRRRLQRLKVLRDVQVEASLKEAKNI